MTSKYLKMTLGLFILLLFVLYTCMKTTSNHGIQDKIFKYEAKRTLENTDNEVAPNVIFQKQFEVIDGEIICKPKKKISHSVKDGINHFLSLAVPENIKELMSELGFQLKDFNGFRLPKLPVLLMAASSNHYGELQGLLLDLKQKVVPIFPEINLVFYDLGLTEDQLSQMKINCSCVVRPFPFHKYPNHVRNLKSYAWKPIIIQTILKEYHFVMYMDASIRINHGDLSEIFRYTLQNGLMLTPPDGPYEVLNNTDIRMFHFLQLNLCEYQGLKENQATMVIISDTWLTHFVLMKWWIVCALSEDCISPFGTEQMLNCPSNPNDSRIASCHRFDQSVLNILTYSIFADPDKLQVSPTYILVLR